MNHHEIFDEICFKRKAVPVKHQLTWTFTRSAALAMTDCAEQLEVTDLFWIGQDQLRGAKMDQTWSYSYAMLFSFTWSTLPAGTGFGPACLFFAIQK